MVPPISCPLNDSLMKQSLPYLCDFSLQITRRMVGRFSPQRFIELWAYAGVPETHQRSLVWNLDTHP